MRASKNQSLMIDFTKEDEVEQLFQSGPLVSSHNAKWNGICLECYQHAANEVPEHAPKQHLILINTQVSKPSQYEQKLGDRLQSDPLREGHVVVVPAEVRNRACWHTEHSYIVLSIDPTVFRCRAFELTESNEHEIIPHFANPDPLLYGIGLALKQEVESENQNGQFYLDSLIATLITHLISHYTAEKNKFHKHTSSFPKQRIRQVINYIQDNLDRDLSLCELAASIHISPSYFSTLFKESTGISPHQYIIQCKIDRAKKLLQGDDMTIAKVACELGFSHQSHLNYHFKRLVGTTPKRFQNSKNLLKT